jgi:hypothetical protein
MPFVIKDVKITREIQNNKELITILTSQLSSFTSNFADRQELLSMPFELKVSPNLKQRKRNKSKKQIKKKKKQDKKR